MLVGHIVFCYQDRSIMLTLTGFDSMHIACIKQFYRWHWGMELICSWKNENHLISDRPASRYVPYTPNLFFLISCAWYIFFAFISFRSHYQWVFNRIYITNNGNLRIKCRQIYLSVCYCQSTALSKISENLCIFITRAVLCIL